MKKKILIVNVISSVRCLILWHFFFNNCCDNIYIYL